jgi:DNA-directed RNA polymerase specialized sigma24 family protein
VRVEDLVRRPGVPAEDLLSVLRVHADRVHDAVRRFGVDAATAVDVVEASGLALVDTVAERPQDVADAAGWWFAEARRLSAQARAARPDLPLGGGLLSADEDQLVLAECLAGLPEDERLAVLVRDAYRLPWSVVAGALQVDEERAAQVVARARVHAVPLLDDEPAPPVASHAGLAELARLGEAGPVAPRDATAQRHTKACSSCAAVTTSQGRVSLLLSGLAVVALPAETRPVLLDAVEGEALRKLPAAAALELTDDEWDAYQDEQRLLPPVLAVLGVLLAVLLGAGVGYLLSRGPGTGEADAGVLPASPSPPCRRRRRYRWTCRRRLRSRCRAPRSSWSRRHRARRSTRRRPRRCRSRPAAVRTARRSRSPGPAGSRAAGSRSPTSTRPVSRRGRRPPPTSGRTAPSPSSWSRATRAAPRGGTSCGPSRARRRAAPPTT